MALVTSLGKTCRHVVGVCSSLIVLEVARDASRARQVVVVVQVAVGAQPRRHLVPSRQGKPDGSVIEVRAQPGIGGVTVLTGGRKLAGRVVWIGGFCEIRSVTGIALCRHRLELAVGGALVAGIAIDGRVRSGQREAVIVLLDLLDRNLPTADGMALFAIRSQLPPVYIRVTVLASLPNVGKHWLDVALHTGHRLVHAAQWVSRLIVVEFRNGADGPPSIRRMAVLAGHVQIPVWTVGASRGLRIRASRESRKREKRHQKHTKNTPTPPHDSPLALVTETDRNRKRTVRRFMKAMQFSVQLE